MATLQKKSSFEQTSSAFRQHLHDLTTPRFTTAATQDVYEYAKFFQDNHAPPWLFDLTQAWAKLYSEPFKGVTSDGNVKVGLFEARDEGVDIENVVGKAEKLLEILDEDQRKKVGYAINAKEWRAWSNPEMLLRPFGLRLEEGMPTPPLLSTSNPTEKLTTLQSPNQQPNPSSASSKPPSHPKATKKP